MKKKTAETLVSPRFLFLQLYLVSTSVSLHLDKKKLEVFFFLQIFTRDASQTSVAVYGKREKNWAHFLPNPLSPFSPEKNILGLFGHMDRIHSHMDMYRVCLKKYC